MASLDKLIQALEQETVSFISKMDVDDTSVVEAFLSRRETLIRCILNEKLSLAEKENYRNSIDRILQYDELVMSKFLEIKEKAQAGMNKVMSGKIQKNGYEASYTIDSVFIDKRK
ncbi:hypothetical protein [Paenibacillus sp. tmac-D7]|uniref:hypothetical protein n=1 Tax=Paenibacillus sp. tmac-D7 TaxID=2591462 RepID=UPI0011417201|nr:hypothetical protein [Paenibacillus sp. tmac-D7]